MIADIDVIRDSRSLIGQLAFNCRAALQAGITCARESTHGLLPPGCAGAKCARAAFSRHI